MGADRPNVIKIENPLWGKIAWTLPTEVVSRFSTETDAQWQDVATYLGASMGKLFGTFIYCLQSDQLIEFEKLIDEFTQKIKTSAPSAPQKKN